MPTMIIMTAVFSLWRAADCAGVIGCFMAQSMRAWYSFLVSLNPAACAAHHTQL
jgi:hypothetical protein